MTNVNKLFKNKIFLSQYNIHGFPRGYYIVKSMWKFSHNTIEAIVKRTFCQKTTEFLTKINHIIECVLHMEVQFLLCT